MDGFWIDNCIYWTVLQLVATFYRSLSHQTTVLSHCFVAASKGGRSYASGLKRSQGDDHLTPTSYSDRWLQPVLPSAASSRVDLTSNCQPPTLTVSSWLASNCRTSQTKVKVMLRPTDSRPVSLGVKRHLTPKTRCLLLSDICGFVDMGRPLWREDGSVVYNCCWSSPAHSFSGPSPAGLMSIFYCFRFETAQPGGWGTG
jgi:hypothetical protein